MSADLRRARLRRSIQLGEPVSDRDFDAIYPPRVRALSAVFWTPVRVAQRAARLLAPTPGVRVLDVGAGVGKFGIVAAACTGTVITGVEHRKHLVRVAQEAAQEVEVSARFIHGDLSVVDWRSFDSFYFYNPFCENVECEGRHIDKAVDLSSRRFLLDLQAARDGIAQAREGARVVTYHGLGTELPPSYRLASKENAGSDALQLWIKTRHAARSERAAEVVFGAS